MRMVIAIHVFTYSAVCPSVGLLVMTLSRAKTAEPIEMLGVLAGITFYQGRSYLANFSYMCTIARV